MIKVNLIPPEYLARQTQKTQVLRVAGVGVLLFVGLMALTFVHIHQATQAETLLKEKEAKLRELQVKVDKVKELEAIKSSVKAHLDALNGLLAARFYYPYFMQDIVKSLAPSVWFQSLSTNVRPDGKINFNVSGMSRSGEDLAEWVNTLETTPKYSETTLGSIGISESAGLYTFSFPLRGVYSPPQGN